MLDQKFSAEAFNEVERNTEEVEELLNSLADTILLEVQEVAENEFRKVVVVGWVEA